MLRPQKTIPGLVVAALALTGGGGGGEGAFGDHRGAAGWRRWVPRCRPTYAAAHFIWFFETAEQLCSDARLGDWMVIQTSLAITYSEMAGWSDWICTFTASRRKTVVSIWWRTNDYERLATARLVQTDMSKVLRCRREA